jgi:hypothetical protein
MKSINGVIIGGCIVVGSIICNMHVSTDRLVSSISVSGTAEKDIKADLISWDFDYETVDENIETAKEASKKAKKEILALLDEAGLVRDEDYKIEQRQLSHSKTGDNIKDVYTITQSYEVKTPKIENVEKAYKQAESFLDKGITINSHSGLAYELKDKDKIQKELMAKALLDAKEKASQIEKICGSTIIGAPNVSWSYVNFRDKNDAQDSYHWKGRNHIDQVAELSISVSYSTK